MWGLLDQNTQAAISILGWKTGSLLMEAKCDLWAGFLLCSCPAVSVPYWTALSAVCPSGSGQCGPAGAGAAQSRAQAVPG